MQNILITNASPKDHLTLTNVAFNAKRSWNYPEEYFDIWKNELTITKEYVNRNIVYNAYYRNEIAGFYSIVENKKDFYAGEVFVQKGFWMEHLFIKQKYQRLGIGILLMKHAKELCGEMKINKLFIFVDPYAEGFYRKIGAKYLYHSTSSVPGRTIPVYELRIT